MTIFKTAKSTHIEDGWYNGGSLPAGAAPPCAALPGSGLPSAYLQSNFYIETYVDDDKYIWVRATTGWIRQSNIYGTEFPMFIVVRPTDFVLNPNDTTGWVRSETVHRASSPGDFTWNISALPGVPLETDIDPNAYGLHRMCHLSQIQYDESTLKGYMYVAASAVFGDITSYKYPNPKRVEITGFVEIINYFPWAKYSGTEWLSCNRSGGALQRYEGNTWVDKKNNFASDPLDKIQYYDGTTWIKAPKIGKE